MKPKTVLLVLMIIVGLWVYWGVVLGSARGDEEKASSAESAAAEARSRS